MATLIKTNGEVSTVKPKNGKKQFRIFSTQLPDKIGTMQFNANPSLTEMRDEKVWLWSEAFTGAVDDLMQDSLAERGARSDWPEHQDRLRWWRGQVESARESYRHGQMKALWMLYDYWQAVAEDAREQARFACDTYRENSIFGRVAKFATQA